MLITETEAYNRMIKIGCDNKCDKAFGHNNRPKIQLDPNDEDDYAYLSDEEVGAAPTNPGTYEGGHAKPVMDFQKHNKWCFRECERSAFCDINEHLTVPNFNNRQYNFYARQREADTLNEKG